MVLVLAHIDFGFFWMAFAIKVGFLISDVNAKTDNDHTSLYFAIQRKHIEISKHSSKTTF